MKRITIIGSGFAALTAVRTVRKLSSEVIITVIAPKAELIYLPSLIWIASGLRKGEDLRINLDRFYARHKVDFITGTVTGLKEGGRTVVTEKGEVNNDGLIIASGGRFIKKLPGIEHAITLCEGIQASERMRDKINALTSGTIAVGFSGNPNEPSAMRGGPMFEVLFALDTQLRRQNKRDKIDIVFFCPAPRPGKRLGEKAVDGLLAEMRKRGIKTHIGHKLVRFELDKVVTEGGEFQADLNLFMPGMTGASWFADTQLPLSAGGMITVDEHCKVAGFDQVYVAGDSGSYPGPDWAPKQAHMADLQAQAASKNLLAELAGTPAKETFKWELICIVDTLDKGILVFRNMKRTLVLPSFLFHYSKRFFEWVYLLKYR